LFVYFSMEPFNDVANNWLPVAQLTATFINAHRKEGTPTVNVRDLIPMLEDEEPLDSDEDEEDEGDNLSG